VLAAGRYYQSLALSRFCSIESVRVRGRDGLEGSFGIFGLCDGLRECQMCLKATGR